MIFTEWYNESWAILLLILGIFGLIALGVFLLRKFILNKNSSEEVDLEKAADENLSRILEEVEDPETKVMDTVTYKDHDGNPHTYTVGKDKVAEFC